MFITLYGNLDSTCRLFISLLLHSYSAGIVFSIYYMPIKVTIDNNIIRKSAVVVAGLTCCSDSWFAGSPVSETHTFNKIKYLK